MHDVDIVVIGAGVIGLAVARALAMQAQRVLVLEKAAAMGSETSARNSEVIHAGLYYATGSLKAEFCLEGRDALYAYCEARHIPHRRCGKLVVANGAAQEARLDALYAKAAANHVLDVVPLDARQARALEPFVQCSAALYSPSSGILDTHALMLNYLADLEAHGGQLVLNCEVERVSCEAGGFRIQAAGTEISCKKLINAAGLWASAVAKKIDGLDAAMVPETYFAKGHYFSVAQRGVFSRLVYPMPEPGGLGVHVTLDMAGQMRFGPDVEWVEQIDYGVSPEIAARFYPAIRTYWPDLPDGALQPAYAGIRPKLKKAGEGDSDFRLDGAVQHGISGLVNLYGIESPGITASLSIGQRVCDMALA